jgi:hypothetical protein
MGNYPSNSYRSKQQKDNAVEKKEIKKVVNGTAKVRKKSEIRKFTDVFISEDAANVKTYIVTDVLIPAAKKLISDIVTDGIDMILYGNAGGGRRRDSSSRMPYVSYNRYSEPRDSRGNSGENRTRAGYNYDDVVLDSYGEAKGVLTAMDDLIDTYGIVSVADLYDLVGISPNPQDYKYGWVNIRNAEPVRVRDGYLLKLPKASPID